MLSGSYFLRPSIAARVHERMVNPIGKTPLTSVDGTSWNEYPFVYSAMITGRTARPTELAFLSEFVFLVWICVVMFIRHQKGPQVFREGLTFCQLLVQELNFLTISVQLLNIRSYFIRTD